MSQYTDRRPRRTVTAHPRRSSAASARPLGSAVVDERTGLPRVGMVGGGQLARMTHQAAIELGQSLRVLAAAPDDSAALVCADVKIGAHTDRDALLAFAAGCDVVTFDHEHVPGELIRAIADAGTAVHPSADALVFAQDKGRMRDRLSGLGDSGA